MTAGARLRTAARDPYASSLVVIVGLGAAGLLAIGMAAAGIADAPTIDAQLPYVASGALGGLALVIVAVGLHAAQRHRLTGARRRAELARVIQAAAAVLAERQSP